MLREKFDENKKVAMTQPTIQFTDLQTKARFVPSVTAWICRDSYRSCDTIFKRTGFEWVMEILMNSWITKYWEQRFLLHCVSSCEAVRIMHPANEATNPQLFCSFICFTQQCNGRCMPHGCLGSLHRRRNVRFPLVIMSLLSTHWKSSYFLLVKVNSFDGSKDWTTFLKNILLELFFLEVLCEYPLDMHSSPRLACRRTSALIIFNYWEWLVSSLYHCIFN